MQWIASETVLLYQTKESFALHSTALVTGINNWTHNNQEQKKNKKEHKN